MTTRKVKFEAIFGKSIGYVNSGSHVSPLRSRLRDPVYRRFARLCGIANWPVFADQLAVARLSGSWVVNQFTRSVSNRISQWTDRGHRSVP